MATIWDVLGIAPTTDESEIRRAYARELKQRRPDKDPQGFQALREAFDSAKRYASSSEPVWIDAGESILLDELPAAPDDVYQQIDEQAEPPEEAWSRNELWDKAQALASQLVRDEITGFGELNHYLDQDIPDALEARQAFSLMLAEALSEQPWLYRSLLNNISAMMDWQLDSYRSSHLPDWTLHALEVQIANTERENYWLILERQYSEGWLNRLKWRLLTQKGTPLPWWARLIPDFVQQLRNQVSELRQQFPLLQERLNPVLLEAIYKPGLALSRGALIAVLFWGYTAYVAGYQSSHQAVQSIIMLAIVAAYIWVYPELERRCEPGGKAYRIQHSAVWLVSLGLLVVALYRAWHGVTYWPGKEAEAETGRAFVMMFFIAVPVCWILWLKRREWRMLPISIVVTVIMFPILFIRQLPMLANLLGFLLLAMLYGIGIPAVYFVK